MKTIPKSRSSVLLLFLFSMLLCAGCGHLPYQWGKVIDPLTAEEVVHFKSRLIQSGSERIMLNTSEEALVLSKLHGPVRGEFSKQSPEHTMWVREDRGALIFHQLHNKVEGHSMVGFRPDGQFYMSGGGMTNPW